MKIERGNENFSSKRQRDYFWWGVGRKTES